MLKLERAIQKDIVQIHTIQKGAFKKLYEKFQDKESPYNETEMILLEKFQRPNNYFYLIKQQQDVIGFIRVVTNREETEAKFSPIAILPKFDGLGYGTKVIGLIENEFPKVKEWCIATIFQEEKLLHFYKKLGYERVDELIRLQDNMDIVILKKKML
ncbi:GNAT family N-acetyltransferase [Vagococcus hydrophili]|uniref:GNAT family N-acetyltransferase n=1 Tax=Vagococcus hydrophili TaxID=2714947 RepID=A0A6G8AX01_9ENTE|nr:GNAT family N-acetyltransferase [Vagococcus hydrophili]QIL49584.1 GNAT family N-acetyltransferase [Vagococcus hydrophili]